MWLSNIRNTKEKWEIVNSTQKRVESGALKLSQKSKEEYDGLRKSAQNALPIGAGIGLIFPALVLTNTPRRISMFSKILLSVVFPIATTVLVKVRAEYRLANWLLFKRWEVESTQGNFADLND